MTKSLAHKIFGVIKDHLVKTKTKSMPTAVRSAALQRCGYRCEYTFWHRLHYKYERCRQSNISILEIHHKNGNHDDHKISNLLVLCGNHHKMMHDNEKKKEFR